MTLRRNRCSFSGKCNYWKVVNTLCYVLFARVQLSLVEESFWTLSATLRNAFVHWIPFNLCWLYLSTSFLRNISESTPRTFISYFATSEFWQIQVDLWNKPCCFVFTLFLSRMSRGRSLHWLNFLLIIYLFIPTAAYQRKLLKNGFHFRTELRTNSGMQVLGSCHHTAAWSFSGSTSNGKPKTYAWMKENTSRRKCLLGVESTRRWIK